MIHGCIFGDQCFLRNAVCLFSFVHIITCRSESDLWFLCILDNEKGNTLHTLQIKRFFCWDKHRKWRPDLFRRLPYRGKHRSGPQAAQQIQYSKGRPLASTVSLCGVWKSAFRTIFAAGFYALFRVEKRARIWYFIITKGNSHNSSIQNLQKERLIKDVRYQEYRKMTLDCGERKVEQSRVIFFYAKRDFWLAV